jgi:hypothetical protein
MDLAGVVSAVAATAAALLAGLNLYVTGRRQDVVWARETLVDAFERFLTASFAVNEACREGARIHAQNGNPEELRRVKLEALTALHSAQMPTLTRIRLLSTPAAAAAANACMTRIMRISTSSSMER